MIDLALSLLQNVSILALAVLFTPLMIDYGEVREWWWRSIALGVVFGLVTLLVTALPVVSPTGAVFDGRAGPLLFAGFLGGPVCGLIAAVIGSAGRLYAGGPFIIPGVTIFFCYALLGAVSAALVSRHGRISQAGLRDLALMFVLSIVAAANMYWLIEPAARAEDWLRQALPLIALANFLSIAVLGATFHVVFALVHERDRASRLAERLELATTSAGIGIWDYDIGGDGIVWDDMQCALHGIRPQDFGGTFAAWEALVHPEDRAAASASARQAIDGEGRFDTEFRIVTPAGTVRHIKGAAVVLRDAAGQPERMIGVNYDLTSLRQVEHAAATQQQRFDDIVATIPGAIFLYRLKPDGSDEIEYMSEGCVDIWEMEPEEIKGDPSPLWDLVDGAMVDDMRASALRSAETLTPWYFEWRMTTVSGKSKWLQGRGWPRKKSDGSVEWSSVVFDVTSQVKTTGDLEKSQKLYFELQKFESIGQLTVGIAHDFNNLLAVVQGNLEFNRLEDLSPAAKAGLEDAIEACQRGANLTRQLLAFGRQAVLSPEPTNLNSAVSQAASLIRSSFRETVRLRLVQAGGLWTAMLDRAAFDNALLNVALNARDAMAEDGVLTITTANTRLSGEFLDDWSEPAAAGRYVMVAISDTGTGIEDDILPKVFDPFFTTKPVGEGTGMGLAMVYGFVKQSQGVIRIDSEKGVGTTVRMYFPATDAIASEEKTTTPSEKLSGTGRVLVAEDDAAVRRTIVRQLCAAGFEVVEAPDGARALEIFESDERIDLLITDCVMPGRLQGPQLAEVIRRSKPGFPIVFMSGYPADAAVHGDGHRAQDIKLMKPISSEDLARAIRVAMGD